MKGLPRYQFERIKERTGIKEQTRSFSHWSHLVSMVYSQISHQKSLRNLVTSFNEQYAHHYHLGTGGLVRSTLSYANNHREVGIFEAMAQHLVQVAGKGNKCKEVLRIIDSSPIHLNPEIYGEFSKSNGRCQGIKLHMEYDANGRYPTFFDITPANVNDIAFTEKLTIIPQATYVFDRGYMKFSWWNELASMKCRFVSRMQKSVRYEVVSSNSAAGKNVIEDSIIVLAGKKSVKGYPQQLRMIRVQLEGNNGKEIAIVSNDVTSPAQDIADLYKRRWEIELLFKWIKQQLKIKHFIGESENAVKIQIISALIAFLLITIYKQKTMFAGSLTQLMVIVRADPFRKANHRILFEKRRSSQTLNSNQLAFRGI